MRPFAILKIEQVKEATCETRVLAKLRDSLLGGEPTTAFEILSNWLYHCSERREQVTLERLRDKIQHVGRYLAERATYHQVWFNFIQPLFVDKAHTNDRQTLAQQFYQGIGARYEHIAAGVDVRRVEKLALIERAFHEVNVVVIHGASGQGKSALAYRYLHDYVPEGLRFEVRRIRDFQDVQRISTALIGHVRALDLPMFVYLDVQPRDTMWVDIVDRLAHYSNIRLIVTIREEDWTRAVSVQWPAFREVALVFDKDEGSHLYTQLVEQQAPVLVLDFNDAWRHFEPPGPLLEFVHLVTQDARLRERLAAQVQALEKELTVHELAFLRIVAVASAYGARLWLGPLVRTLGLSSPMGTLVRLEREYLLRTSVDGELVEGLHPIRSHILVEILTDPVLVPWFEAAEAALPVIVESDLESFCLYAFSRHGEQIDRLLQSLYGLIPQTWTGRAGVLRTLIWLGVRRHLERLRPYVDIAYECVGEAWSVMVLWDVVNLRSWYPGLGDIQLDVFDQVAEEFREARATLRRHGAEEPAPFIEARHWLAHHEIAPRAPADEVDWAAVAEVVFWTGFWHLPLANYPWITQLNPEDALRIVPFGIACDVLFALSFLHHPDITQRLDAVREAALDKFCTETARV